MHALCNECQNRQDQIVLRGELNRASCLPFGDDDADSEPSTEFESNCGITLQRLDKNLIIFDWDDTLFPTTWLHEQGLLEKDALISTDQDMKLQALADLVAATLEAAKRCGGVCIVTNAEHGWVELSCRTFMPSLLVHLQAVRVVSARSQHEQHGLLAPTMWKCLAFEGVISEFYSPSEDAGAAPQRRSVVSLGDSEHELEALKWAVAGTECRAKSLKFVDRPCMERLMEQHELVASVIENVVDHEGNLDYEIGVEDS